MSGWTEQEDATASRLWNDGKSATEVALAVGKSRNAVIGRVHRKPDIYRPHGQRAVKRERQQMAQQAREARLKKLQARARAVEKAKAEKLQAVIERKAAVAEKAVSPLFPQGERNDLSRDQVAETTVAFVDLKVGQCKFPLVAFNAVAGPFSPCCGAATEEPLGSWCAVHAGLVTSGRLACEAA